MHMHLLKISNSLIFLSAYETYYCTDRFSIPAWNNMANNSGKP